MTSPTSTYALVKQALTTTGYYCCNVTHRPDGVTSFSIRPLKGCAYVTVRGNVLNTMCWHGGEHFSREYFRLGGIWLSSKLTEGYAFQRYTAQDFEALYSLTHDFRFPGATLLYHQECDCEAG